MPSVGNESNHTMDGLTVRGGLGIVGANGVTTFLDRDSSSFTARKIAQMRAEGFYAETTPRHAISTAAVATSGVIYFVSCGLIVGDVVTNLTMACTAAATTATLAKVAIYSKTGTLLGSSADFSSTLGTAGIKTNALTTPYTVTADDAYYLAFLNVAGTGATFGRSGVSGGAIGNAVGSGMAAVGQQTGQTDLTSPATIAVNSVGAAWWIAVS